MELFFTKRFSIYIIRWLEAIHNGHQFLFVDTSNIKKKILKIRDKILKIRDAF